MPVSVRSQMAGCPTLAAEYSVYESPEFRLPMMTMSFSGQRKNSREYAKSIIMPSIFMNRYLHAERNIKRTNHRFGDIPSNENDDLCLLKDRLGKLSLTVFFQLKVHFFSHFQQFLIAGFTRFYPHRIAITSCSQLPLDSILSF